MEETDKEKQQEIGMKKVSVIGHFAVGHQYLNGQTIKTKIVTGELERVLGSDQVGIVDTHGGPKTLLKAPFFAGRITIFLLSLSVFTT